MADNFPTNLFAGKVRKLAVLFIGLTAVGWVFVVIGFGIGSNQAKGTTNFSRMGLNDKNEPKSYPFWIVCISGPLTLIAALLHVALSKQRLTPFLEAVIAFLNIFFVSGLGMILFKTGDIIRLYNEDFDFDSDDIPPWFHLEFAGAFLATLFWMVVMVFFWPFLDGISAATAEGQGYVQTTE